MESRLQDDLFIESYMMMNFEITFTGVRKWFEMANIQRDDSTLFRNLLFPEQVAHEEYTELAGMIINRYEDVYFQISRMSGHEGIGCPHYGENDSIHLLLLKMMHVRSIYGIEDAIIELGCALQKDKLCDKPIYFSLYQILQRTDL